jgi:hypothetical protein
MKHSKLFLVTLVLGALILTFGMYLLIFKQYHERAYVFLGTGAACLIGGIAGVISVYAKVKMAIFYGIMAFSVIGLAVGVNYLTYRFIGDQQRGYAVLAVGTCFLIVGIVGGIVGQPHARLAAFFSTLALGVIASGGIAILLIGSHLLTIHRYRQDAYIALATGIICLVGGIIIATLTQNKAAVQRR